MTHNPPTYIVAVSGGVDSCALLDMLVKRDAMLEMSFPDNTRFIVAHVNHGIRGESSNTDQEFVKALAESYGLLFETIQLHLGAEASEETARTARYEFLDKLVHKYHATGLILAHHADDVVETAVINFIRGTGRRGLSSLDSSQSRIRPLLHMKKQNVLDYAVSQKLQWVEDETNQDEKYLRNRVRSRLAVSNPSDKDKFATELHKIKHTNLSLDSEISKVLQYRIRDKYILSRSWFVKLPHDLACEVMHAVLTKLGVNQINRQLVEKLTIALKVAKPGTRLDIDKQSIGLITKRSLRFVNRETLKTYKV